MLPGEAWVACGQFGAKTRGVDSTGQVGADAEGDEEDDARGGPRTLAHGQDGARVVHRHGVQRGPSFRRIDKVGQEVRRPGIPVRRVDIPDQRLGGGEGDNRAQGAGSVGESSSRDGGGEGQLPDRGAGLVELQGALAPEKKRPVVAPSQGFDSLGQPRGMPIQPPCAVGRLKIRDPALANGVGDGNGGEVSPRRRRGSSGRVRDQKVDAEGARLQDDGLGGEKEPLAAQPTEGPHEPRSRIAIGKVAMNRAGHETRGSGSIPSPNRRDWQAFLAGLDAGEHGAVGPDGGELPSFGAGWLRQPLPAGLP